MVQPRLMSVALGKRSSSLGHARCQTNTNFNLARIFQSFFFGAMRLGDGYGSNGDQAYIVTRRKQKTKQELLTFNFGSYCYLLQDDMACF